MKAPRGKALWDCVNQDTQGKTFAAYEAVQLQTNPHWKEGQLMDVPWPMLHQVTLATGTVYGPCFTTHNCASCALVRVLYFQMTMDFFDRLKLSVILAKNVHEWFDDMRKKSVDLKTQHW